MSISSLQSLIQKYGANFGIKPQTASSSASTSASTSNGSGSAEAKPAEGKPSNGTADGKPAAPSKLDSLDLSPAARDFLASHTGALGQFEVPNMMDYFFATQDGSDGASDGSGSKPLSSLADFL